MKPYYAVIFTSKLSRKLAGYAEMSEKILKIAKEQEGFLGYESARSNLRIFISYWDSLESIEKWRANTTHREAIKKGRLQWYEAYQIRICSVERAYEFKKTIQKSADVQRGSYKGFAQSKMLRHGPKATSPYKKKL